MFLSIGPRELKGNSEDKSNVYVREQKMTSDSTTKQASPFPWGAILAGAAIGAAAIVLAKHLHGSGSMQAATVEDALHLCDRAVDLLESRLSQVSSTLSMVG